MKIVSLNKGNWGKKRVVAFDGEIEIGEDGVAEVSQKAADHLVENGPQWAYLGRESEKMPPPFPDADKEVVNHEAENAALKKKIAELEAKAKEPVAAKEEVEEKSEATPEAKTVASVAGADDEAETEEDAEAAKADKLKQAREILEAKKKGELQDLCVKKEFPKEEWEELLKADLVEYLMGKV